MSAMKRPTPRTRLLGLYFQVKAACWFAIGIALAWGFVVAGELGTHDSFLAMSYFLLLFAVPAILLWILGISIRIRISWAWWFAVGYLVAILIGKALLGTTDLPWEAWSWVSTRLPSFYIRGFQAFAIFSTAVLAADVAALASLISLPARASFGIGNVDRATLEDVGEGTFW